MNEKKVSKYGEFYGKPGRSGRKTKAEEFNTLKLLIDNQDQEEIERKIGTGKFSILDRAKLTAMEGDSRLLSKFMDKAIPDAGKDDKANNQNITINILKVSQDGLDRIQVQPKTISVRNTRSV